jgi:hypothetical protein
MGSWYYLWENGDVSFVSAASKDEAALMLDEVGEALPERLKPINGGFFVGFSPTKKPPDENNCGWEPDQESESVTGTLSDVEEEARRRLNIPEKLMAPVNLLHLLSTTVRGRGDLKDFDLKDAVTKQVWKDESTEYVQQAVDLVETYLKEKKTILAELACTGTQLSELLDDVVNIQRSIIFKEKKGLV